MCYLLISILIIISLNSSIYCSYSYAGCYTQIFYDSYFTSSLMEPTLCFRLCDTPIIYIQSTVCRCSGGGLMHYDKQPDQFCPTACPKPVDRDVTTRHTCGGLSTYSAYVQNTFYSKHGHLFDYRIQFSSCELWKSSDVYDILEVDLSKNPIRSSLNKLEQCAAACLDQSRFTKSIAFHEESTICVCVLPLRQSKSFDRKVYIDVLSNTSCNRYCDNSYEGSKTRSTFQCGSLNNTKIWAVYDLNGTCPTNSIYIKELKKCVSTYRYFWNSCTPPSVSFVFNENVTWPILLKAIDQLQLKNTTVSIDIDESVVIDTAWKCASAQSGTTTPSYSFRTPYSRPYSFYGLSSTTRYILENNCLVESSYTHYNHRYANRLCVVNPIDIFSSDDDTDEISIAAVNPQMKFCPTDWFDLNGRCYRVSEARKTIEQAHASCIDVSANSLNKFNQTSIWLLDSNGNIIGGSELNDSPSGEISTYVSEWQARIGFFLLDTDPDHDQGDPDTTTSIQNLYYDDAASSADSNDTIDTNHTSINEFHLLDSFQNATNNNTCTVITRSITEEGEKPIIRSALTNNCTKPRHVLCETNTLIVPKFQYSCLKKPNILDIPALISKKHLTHELCLTVCQELQTRLAILHINKCYCLNGARFSTLNVSTDFQEFRQNKCGNTCPGNPNELCGNNDTIVVFQILDSRRTFTYARTPPEPFPYYVYDSCLSLPTYDQKTIYQFKSANKNNFHPRYCVDICVKHDQKYALINNGDCLCTNVPLKNGKNNAEVLRGQECSQPCPGSYFYSCGHNTNTTIYSMYLLQTRCRHGFEVAENDQQCVYSHFSTKRSSIESARDYCKSIGSTLAKINDVVEMQDILPDSILHTRLMNQLLIFYKFRFINDTRYYWMDRTQDKPNENTISERLLKQCSKTPEKIDKNCISLQYVVDLGDEDGTVHERCIVESNECSTITAMPVCVDRHVEPKPTEVPPISDANPAQLSVDVTVDHLCDDPNDEYDLIDDYCYKIINHEVSWKDAQEECQRDQATLFVPEKSITLQYIKTLYLRQRTYTSSDFVHVGVYYDTSNRTIIETNVTNSSNVSTIPDSNAIYDLCEKTFLERYAAIMNSTSLSESEKTNITNQKIGCAYMDLVTSVVPTIHCDDIPCKRIATVVCQKVPMKKRTTVLVKREYVETPSTDVATDTSPIESTSSTDFTESMDTNNTSDDDDDPATTYSTDTTDGNSTYDFENPDSTSSVGRDYAPMFIFLIMLAFLCFLGITITAYNRRSGPFRHRGRRTANSVYSQLTAANEFDLN